MALIVLGLLVAWVAVHQVASLPTKRAPAVVLDEDFDRGTLDSAVWNTCHWWAADGCTIASNNELEWYRPEQVSVANGTLRLEADRDLFRAPDGRTYPYQSGMVTTGPASDGRPAKVAITYGTVEARVKVPAGRGLWPAIWLLPTSQESRPEIDLMEVIGQNPSELIMHLHPADRDNSDSHRYQLPAGSLADGWHTLGLIWAPGRLDFRLDGATVWTVTGDQVPDEPMYLVMNLAVGGAYPGHPDHSTRFPATFEIDYVRMSTGG